MEDRTITVKNNNNNPYYLIDRACDLCHDPVLALEGLEEAALVKATVLKSLKKQEQLMFKIAFMNN